MRARLTGAPQVATRPTGGGGLRHRVPIFREKHQPCRISGSGQQAPGGGREERRERTRRRARDNYDNHFVCEPRAKETGQNEDDDDDSTRMKRWMEKKKKTMTTTMTIGNRFRRQVVGGTVGADDISVVVVN